MEIAVSNIETMEIIEEKKEVKVKTRVRREEMETPEMYPGFYSTCRRVASTYWDWVVNPPVNNNKKK